MKILSIAIFVALLPLAVNAAGLYNYECENDADGAEGLCLAAPADAKETSVADAIPLTRQKGRPPRDKTKMNAQSRETPKTIFGASDVVTSEALAKQTGSPSSVAESQVGINLGAQEKIRQVETFLQPIKGPQGFGENGPAKAGK